MMQYRAQQFHRPSSVRASDVGFFQNAIVHWLVIGTLFISFSLFVVLLYYVHPSNIQLKLQYNVFFGSSLYSSWWGAYVLPLMAIFFFLVDLGLAYYLYLSKERVGAYILLLSAFFVHLALSISIISLILNNF